MIAWKRMMLAVSVSLCTWGASGAISSVANAATAMTDGGGDGNTRVTAPVNEVFVPTGFDDNDTVEVVIAGEFPDSCYRLGPVQATVDYTGMSVMIDAQASRSGDETLECALVMTHFEQSVRLGALPQGTYQIYVKDRPNLQIEPLIVGPSRGADPNEPILAPVQDVSLEQDNAGRQYLTLTGDYPYTFVGCMLMQNVDVRLDPGNVIVVLPYAGFTDGADCVKQSDSKFFSVSVEVPEGLPPGDYLAHVKGDAGLSINRVVSVEP